MTDEEKKAEVEVSAVPFENKIVLPIRKTVAKKRHDVGRIEVPYPTLHDVADSLPEPTGFAEVDDDQPELGKVPVYDDPVMQWAQDALVEAVKRESRNVADVPEETAPFTINLRRPIPDSWQALLEEHKREGGAHLAIRAECIRAFGEWLAGLNKSAGATKKALLMFSNLKVASASPQATRERFAESYLLEFCKTLSEEDADKYSAHLENLTTALEVEEVDDDDF